MSFSAANTIASVWPLISGMTVLNTPGGQRTFNVVAVSANGVTVTPGSTSMVVPRSAFENAIQYLHDHNHDRRGPCVINAKTVPEEAGPLCRVSRLTTTGSFGPRNITYVLPILQALGLVEIEPKSPARTWIL
jgi:hypothetical protein